MTNKNGKIPIKILCDYFIFIAISLIFIQFFTGCASVRGMIEGGMAFMENPSMELVLDRLNTAACISMTAKAVLSDIPISKDSKWPEEMERFPSDQFAEIIRVLAMDRAYRDNGGQISSIKAHLVQVQTILYDVPPDLYARQGDCYEVGEETFINNYYFKILGGGKFIKKAFPSSSERNAALNNAIKQFLDFSDPDCDHTTFYKRKGKYKESLLNKIATENGYRNITYAIISVLEGYNSSDIEDLKISLDETKSVIEDIKQINTLTMSLENKKTRIKNKENVLGYKSIKQVDNDLSVKQKEMTQKKERLEELQLIVNKSFENIQNDLPIVSENDLEVLEKISAACKALEGLFMDAFTLTTIVLLKTPTSVMGIKDELKRMNAQKATNPFIPIRVARLKANTGNVIGNINTIVYVLKNERRMVGLIKSTADKIIMVTRQSIENQGEHTEKAPINDTVDKAIVLAEADKAMKAETKIATPEINPFESVESVPLKTTFTKVEISVAPEITRTEFFTETPKMVVTEQKESPQQLIENFLSDWSTAWSSQNITDYLSCYAKEFIPAAGKSRKQWERIRRKRFQKKGIHVEIVNIDIQNVNDNKVKVNFIQVYQSKTYRDRVLKQLSLIREAGKWKIKSEKQLKVLAR